MSNSSGFFVTVTGEVAGAQVLGADDVYCKYSFNYGPDWTVLHGLEHGITQICRLSPGRADKTFTWNYPIDLSFKSTNAHGWPQIVISVYSINGMGKDVVKGYASVHIPTTPGRHIRYVRIYRPVSSSLCQRFTSWLMGSPPEFFNAKFTAQGRGREVTRVASAGTVKLVFNVATRGMGTWGYEVNDGTAVGVSGSMQGVGASGIGMGVASGISSGLSGLSGGADGQFGSVNAGQLRAQR